MSCVDEVFSLLLLESIQNVIYFTKYHSEIIFYVRRGGDDDIFGSTTWTENERNI